MLLTASLFFDIMGFKKNIKAYYQLAYTQVDNRLLPDIKNYLVEFITNIYSVLFPY